MSLDDNLDSLLAEQVAYYRARADEYDETGVVSAELERGRGLHWRRSARAGGCSSSRAARGLTAS